MFGGGRWAAEQPDPHRLEKASKQLSCGVTAPVSGELDAKTQRLALFQVVTKGCEHVLAPRKCPSFLVPGQTWQIFHDLVPTRENLGLLEYQIFGPMGVLFFSDELHRP